MQKQNNFWSWDKYRKFILDSTMVNYNELIHQIETATNKNRGKHSLIIQVNNHQQKYALALLSRNRKLSIDKEFIQQIEKITAVGLKIT